MRVRGLLFFVLALQGAGCSTVDVTPDGSYSRKALLDQEPLAKWSLDGRLSLSGGKESWSANLVWEHKPELDQLKLSGPLGQGATRITVNAQSVSIDRGGGNIQSSSQVETFINQQLGMSVPLRALRYWIVGLPEPGQAFVDVPSGFSQSGWMVEYKQMQVANKYVLPRKMTVMNETAKLKLIIDQWVVDEPNGQ